MVYKGNPHIDIDIVNIAVTIIVKRCKHEQHVCLGCSMGFLRKLQPFRTRTTRNSRAIRKMPGGQVTTFNYENWIQIGQSWCLTQCIDQGAQVHLQFQMWSLQTQQISAGCTCGRSKPWKTRSPEQARKLWLFRGFPRKTCVCKMYSHPRIDGKVNPYEFDGDLRFQSFPSIWGWLYTKYVSKCFPKLTTDYYWLATGSTGWTGCPGQWNPQR